MNILKNKTNTVGIILVPILAEIINFPCWREEEAMNNPRDMCHFYTVGTKDVFHDIFKEQI